MEYEHDKDEEELYDYYDEDPDDPYPPVIFEINEEKLLELFYEVKKES